VRFAGGSDMSIRSLVTVFSFFLFLRPRRRLTGGTKFFPAFGNDAEAAAAESGLSFPLFVFQPRILLILLLQDNPVFSWPATALGSRNIPPSLGNRRIAFLGLHHLRFFSDGQRTVAPFVINSLLLFPSSHKKRWEPLFLSRTATPPEGFLPFSR